MTMKNMMLLVALTAGFTAFGAIEKIPLKSGWKFVKGDDPRITVESCMSNEIRKLSAILDRADRGDLSGAPAADWCKVEFDDAKWASVLVPHDWGMMKSYDWHLPYGDGFLDVTGIGWYRKTFAMPKVPANGKVLFECDGAMSYSMVWINGHFVGGWPYGYTRFRLDLTPYLKTNGENVLAIRCHNIPHSSRWYTGGGLYRNCRLLVCPEDYVIPGSVFITTPEITQARATVRVRYEMSKSGKKDYTFTVTNPRLWDIDDPYLYSVDIEGNTYRYGIRTIAFNADERRFQLNGRTVPLNGVSMHHDFGVLGAAWNRDAQKRRLLKFKEAGVNAIRSSHNPPEEELLELCDELGLLVKDEVFDEWRHLGNCGKRMYGYTNLYDVWHERDLRGWIRTDRNHPCVIMYSIGNEICDGWRDIAPYEEFIESATRMARMAAEEDPTRPTTNANNNPANYTNDYPRVMAIMGCNYYSWQYPRLKAAHPDVPYYGSETVCLSSTRGAYFFPVITRWEKFGDLVDFSNSSYCWEATGWKAIDNGWASSPDVQWYWMDKVGTCMGEFIWTGIDYLGGPAWCDTARKSPRFRDPVKQAKAEKEVKEHGMTSAAIHTCNTGFLDQAGFRKDLFYLFQSRWMPEKPMAHILPHWNWAGREGEVTPVYVFTSGDEGELFLNGKSLGRRRKQPGVWDRAYRLRWDDVRYQPGTLEVVVYKNGKEWARDTVKTTGEPAALVIESENPDLRADGEAIAFVNVKIVDKDGLMVPTADNEVMFTVEGEGFVLATDNGYEGDMSDFHLPNHAAFNGLVQALIRANRGGKGELKVTATAKGLKGASVTIRLR